MDITLRAGGFRDIDQISKIEKTSFPERPYSKLDFAYFLLLARASFVVACKDGLVVGYVIAMQGTDAWIQSIAVLPEFRQKGIGETLMRSAIVRLAEKSERVSLLVDAGNAVAIRLYQKLSFVETGTVKRRYYPNGGDAVEMARELGPATLEEP